MANLMVANGMEDEGFEREELLKKYSGELKKDHIESDLIFRKSQKLRKLTPLEKVKELRQRMHAVDGEPTEMRYISRETIGAETAFGIPLNQPLHGGILGPLLHLLMYLSWNVDV